MATPSNVATYGFSPGRDLTCVAGAAITGKRFVKIGPGGFGNQPRVIPANAGDHVFGVAFSDAAQGDTVLVVRTGSVTVTASAATITAGAPISAGAGGVAVAASASLVIGEACNDTAANGECFVALSVA